MPDKNEVAHESIIEMDLWMDHEAEIPQDSLKNVPSYGTSRKVKRKNEPDEDDSVDEPPDAPGPVKSKKERTADKDDDSVDEPPDSPGHRRASAPESDLFTNNGGGTRTNNSDLVVANMVDGSKMANIPFAQPMEYDPDRKPKKIQRERKRKTRFWVLTGLAGALIVALIIVIAVVVTSNRGEKDKNVPITSIDGVANVPTEAPTQSRFSCIARRTAFLSDPSTLDDPASPQSRALWWITNEDPLGLDCGTNQFLLQRYALAVFYFSTTKDDSKWLGCGPTEEPTDTDCTGFQLLSNGNIPLKNRKYKEIPNQKQWLKGTNECEWYGILCQDEGLVVAINLGGNNLKGMIPDEIGFFENTVNEIQLSVNQLTGTIPSEIGLLSLLFFFDVSYNKLTGTIPEEIYHQESDLDNIIVLGNMISGTISTRIGQLNNLKLFNGARNIFDGTLPTQIGNVTPLGMIFFLSFLRRLDERKVNLLFISFALF
mmetsp:Transcript_6093/g.10810  ORF Transcript_6093/g.10810 Transcript_6093/m.10810 type:complete len:485 (-) Transcript_6093:128-1582(-)